MPIRLLFFFIIFFQLATGPLFSQDSEKDQNDATRPPIEARLIVNQSKYVLPKDRHGETFRKRIVEETDTDKLPPPPRVDLVLELKNVSNENVMIWPRGAITKPELIVEGPGIVEPENLRTISGSSDGTSVQPTIKPGKTFRIAIKSLNLEGGTPWVFWNQPGEYSIKATYTVYTGLPPFPFPGEKQAKGAPKKYEVSTPPVKVQVVSEQPQRPLIVAHRGLLRHAPENTLANFRACLELRLGFEFDVQKSNDGQLICIHDDTVDRTTDGVGHVSEFSMEEIRKLDAGRWFDARFAGEKVPTVEEVFQLIAQYREHDILIAVDLKADEVEEDVVKLAEMHKLLDKLLFIGTTISEPFVREDLKKTSKKAQTAVVANTAQEFAAALAAEDGDWVYFRYLPSKEEIEAVHKKGKRAFIAGSTVSGNVPDNWRKATNVGMDAVLTDYPLELRTTIIDKK